MTSAPEQDSPRNPATAPSKADSPAAHRLKRASMDEAVRNVASQLSAAPAPSAAVNRLGLVRAEPTVAPGTSPAPAHAPAHIPKELGVYDLEPRLFEDNPLNARRIYLDAALTQLGEDMRRRGQLVPVRAFVADERLVLIDGHRRVRAARLVNISLVRVEVVEPPAGDERLYFDSLAANLHREPPTPLDDALVWSSLLERGVFTSQEQLADALRENKYPAASQTHVSRTLSLIGLPESVRDACIAAGGSLVTLRFLSALRSYFAARGESDTLRLVLEAREHALSARDIESRVKSAARPPASKPHALRYRVDYGQAQGELREFDHDGRVELRIKGLEAPAREALVARLRELLETDPQLAKHGKGKGKGKPVEPAKNKLAAEPLVAATGSLPPESAGQGG